MMEEKSKLPTIDDFPDSTPIYLISKADDFDTTFTDEGEFVVYSPTKLCLYKEGVFASYNPSFRGLRREPADLTIFKAKMADMCQPCKEQLEDDEAEILF